MDTSTIASKSPDIMSGALVFAGTRVPVKSFIDYIISGETLDSFLDDSPSVTRDQAIAFLKLAEASLVLF